MTVTPTAAEPLFTLYLPAAQRAWAQLPRGTQVVVRGGTIRLHLRTPLASLWAPLPVVLGEGDAHELPGGGWVEMEALHTAQVVAVVGERGSAWQWLVGHLGRWVGRVRRPVLGC